MLELGERLAAVGRAEARACGERIPIVLGGGRAFGSGEHETTRSCLEELEAMQLEGQTLLDLGCGTGILAIAACKLGAAGGVAVDTHPHAVAAAARNVELNQLAGSLQVIEGSIQVVRHRRFDLILANLWGDLVLAHVAEFAEMLRPGGHLLVSGIQLEYAFDIKAALEKLGFTLLRYRILDEYATLVHRNLAAP
jgi:ribosomal protein L11 methyltransferase